MQYLAPCFNCPDQCRQLRRYIWLPSTLLGSMIHGALPGRENANAKPPSASELASSALPDHSGDASRVR